ncbi:uncharacterized protein LOC122464389 [Chelonia mydas]|uniref:uncharacterized protein LOC122464389 n=1 Tax=Chelonia mydas TaxID=8469 RepID=UPI001CA953E5|nr:uncharacterized protein LOC122464389 [Chelonia mydas]
MWAADQGVSPVAAPIQLILDYLLHLRAQGLVPSSVKVHLAAISAFHPPVQGHTVFFHAMTGQFLKGLDRLFPYSRPPVPQWELNLVLARLTGPLFEPLATCSWSHLSWKVAFLVAITSARQVSELRALTSESLYTVFHKDKVQLRPHPAFLPKVVSAYHMGQDIFLPVLCPKSHAPSEEHCLHTLDVWRALALYLERTRPFRRSSQLFVSSAQRARDQPISTQRLSSRITSCIGSCCELTGVPPPPIVRANSTWVQASSAAFMAHVPIQDICRAATWSSVHTLTSHYAIVPRTRDDAECGRAVLCPGNL